MALTPFGKVKKQKEFVPLEGDEQKLVVQYLEQNGFKFTSIPNATYTTSWASKQKNTNEGLRGGLPDLLLYLPKRGDKEPSLLFLEMKRVRGGVVSAKQRDWIEVLNTVQNVEAIVARGAREAISLIKSYL